MYSFKYAKFDWNRVLQATSLPLTLNISMAVTKKTSKVALLEQSVTENPSNLNVSLSPFLLLQPL